MKRARRGINKSSIELESKIPNSTRTNKVLFIFFLSSRYNKYLNNRSNKLSFQFLNELKKKFEQNFELWIII